MNQALTVNEKGIEEEGKEKEEENCLKLTVLKFVSWVANKGWNDYGKIFFRDNLHQFKIKSKVSKLTWLVIPDFLLPPAPKFSQCENTNSYIKLRNLSCTLQYWFKKKMSLEILSVIWAQWLRRKCGKVEKYFVN